MAAIRTQDLTASLSDKSLLRTQGYINGQWVEATDGKTYTLKNPATGAQLGSLPSMPRAQITEAIKYAKTALPAWAALTAYQRQKYLLDLFNEMQTHAEDLAIILTTENGKPLAEARGEIAYGSGFVSWFAAEAIRTYGHTVPSPYPGTRNTVIKQPVGVCGLITPWNFPNGMITRKMAPALAAGCTVVIKAPAETPLSAIAMAILCERVGIPAGVVNVVIVDKGEREVACGLELCESPLISKISFTGSTAVGKLLMKQSSSTLKKLSFELGGNAAFVVFDDADLDIATDSIIASKFRAAGQTCVCANRIFVHAKVYDEFAKRLTSRVDLFKVGNPMTEGVNIGPLINQHGVDKVHRHVKDAIAGGARALIGGAPIEKDDGSCFYQPTVLVDVPRSCAIASEETFGPLAALFKFEDEDDVVASANDTDVGLAGYLFTKDVSRTHRVAEKMQVGMVAVNTGVISAVAIPFGGIKQSGFGREGGRDGINEYMVEKLISIGGI